MRSGTLPLLDPAFGAVVAGSGSRLGRPGRRGRAGQILFGAATGLPRARLLALLVLAVTLDAVLLSEGDHDAIALIATLAIGVAIVLQSDRESARRLVSV